ncbi:hypothetical protein DY000_02019889 [Brassica cretica]|uniref:Uncharacterized protein n=1 Tax=Brassica cretica TaxID=69181 RepID=A0ABQ7D5N4_BRACR|nr:hypothetical protein DY000_02019889 [Brassica cretica]
MKLCHRLRLAAAASVSLSVVVCASSSSSIVVICASTSSSIHRRLRRYIVLDPSSFAPLHRRCSKESLQWEFNLDKNRNASFIYIEEDLQYEDLVKMVSKDFVGLGLEKYY